MAFSTIYSDDHKISLKMIRDASTPSSSNHNFRTITIITAALSFVTISVFLSSIIISLAYCYCCRKRSSEEHSEQDLEDGHSPTLEEFGSGNMCEAFIPQGKHMYIYHKVYYKALVGGYICMPFSMGLISCTNYVQIVSL